MKRLVLFFLFGCSTKINSHAQEAVKQPKRDSIAAAENLPYKKDHDLPVFNIRLMDSISIFNTFNIPKGRPVLLMLFSPDCKHCRLMTRKLLKSMDSLSSADIYMVTPMYSMTALRNFYDEFHLADYKNIKVIGRDYEFAFHDFFGTKLVPDIALYDKRKKLVKLFEGDTTVEELHRYLRDLETK